MKKGIKQSDIKKCCLCDEGVGKGVDFFIVSSARYFLDIGAVQRQTGLEMSMGAAAGLAQIMGPDEDIARQIDEQIDQWVCAECAYQNPTHLVSLLLPESD